MIRPLDALLKELADECPLCGESPTGIEVRGPDEIVLGGCGHVADAREWLDRHDVNEMESSTG